MGTWARNKKQACRLFIIFARESPRAILFRRGPTKWTRLILWNTDTDEFTYGQWFNGRIYERRCDLSPDGNLLIYFVHKINGRTLKDTEYTYAWTAVSKPPYLTALALWPKGDCWHGGGLFDDNTTVFLNHKPAVAVPHPKHLPQKLTVHPNPNAGGEDEPIYAMRLDRYGWKVEQEWKLSYEGIPRFYVTQVPEIRSRAHPTMNYRILLTRRMDVLDYKETFSVVDDQDQYMADTMRAEWVDWDKLGRLVILKDGKIFVGVQNGKEFEIKEIANFNAQVPESIVAPEWATKWQ